MAGVCHLLKNSKSAIKLLQMVLASPRMPKREFLRLNPPKHTTHELQRTAGTTPPSVTPWEFAGVVWEIRLLLGETRWAHDTAKTEVSGRNGTWGAAGGDLRGHLAFSGRTLSTAFVAQRNLLNQATRKSQYVPERKAVYPTYLFALLMRTWSSQGAFGSVNWHLVINECHDMKGNS
jgi:hypothetical protein